MPYKLQPADVQAIWEEYRHQCDENIETVRYRDKLVQVPKKIIYSLQGFCLFLDLGEEDLKRYEDNKNYRAIFKKIPYQVMCRKMHALVNGEGNARALIYDLKVNHGIDPKHVQEEDIDWKITLNLNHDNPGWEPPKRESEEDGEDAGWPPGGEATGEEAFDTRETQQVAKQAGSAVVATPENREQFGREGPEPPVQALPVINQPEPPGLGYGKYSIW